MNPHLSDEQLAEILSGTLTDSATRQHLSQCRECSDELNRLTIGIAGFVAVMNDAAQQRPYEPIAVRSPRSKRAGLVWVAAALLTAMALSLLRWAPEPSPRQSSLSPSSDDTLLLEIQQDLNREVPRALSPALVLTAERNRIIGQATHVQNR